MKVAQIYIEYANMAVDKSFSYFCGNFTVRRGLRVEVEFAYKKIIGFVWDVIEMKEEDIKNMPYEMKPILNVIDEKPLLNEELFSLAMYMSQKCIAPLISCLGAMLPSKLKPKTSFKKAKQEVWVVFDHLVEVRGKKQEEAMYFMQQQKEMLRSEFNRFYSTQLKSLIEGGVVHLETKEATSKFNFINEDNDFILSTEQEYALSQMSSQSGYQVFLLHGVTGSGKSEVFLRMAEKVIDEGKQVLFLVPEIGLTPQMIKHVSARFGNDVAIYHSSLNNQEKYEQYKLVLEKKVKIVVGTRSSIFMPFDNLGLIIMDEEHDQSYKQDSTPKYHTKDIAMFRAKHHNCPLLLASATPSLESYARAIKKVYTLIEMPTRINGCMPETKLIDMKDSMREGQSYILSDILKQEIEKRLSRHEQCILLLNRRGYAPILRCMDCGDVVKCPHCDMALNYHKQTNEMKCHVCGYSEPRVFTCKKCGGKKIRYMGMGTQKLEEYVQECFPQANIVRMDFDTTSRKNAHEHLLKTFEEKGDILLGTQMIAKGLDFERVTLVGILNGDALLNRSDYRSVELTFDLLVQASGRSGRKDKEGKVLIQVYDKEHYAIRCARNHDYKTFFNHEMRFRHLGGYPPYTYLGAITLLSKEEDDVQEIAQRAVETLRNEEMKILGPVELVKIMDLYRRRIIIKGKDEDKIATLIYSLYKKHLNSKSKVKMEIDMNPYMLE